jgi:hypothetical protein
MNSVATSFIEDSGRFLTELLSQWLGPMELTSSPGPTAEAEEEEPDFHEPQYRPCLLLSLADDEEGGLLRIRTHEVISHFESLAALESSQLRSATSLIWGD